MSLSESKHQFERLEAWLRGPERVIVPCHRGLWRWGRSQAGKSNGTQAEGEAERERLLLIEERNRTPVQDSGGGSHRHDAAQ